MATSLLNATSKLSRPYHTVTSQVCGKSSLAAIQALAKPSTRLPRIHASYGPASLRSRISYKSTSTELPRPAAYRFPYSTRCFSSCTSPAAATIPDPERQDLFYHLFEPPHELSPHNAVFALSFLSEPPSSVVSPAIIGWLPALTEGLEAGLNDFTENCEWN